MVEDDTALPGAKLLAPSHYEPPAALAPEATVHVEVETAYALRPRATAGGHLVDADIPVVGYPPGPNAPRTGETQFLPAQTGLPAAAAIPVGDSDDEYANATELHDGPITLDTDGFPRRPGDRRVRRLLTRGVPALALLGVIAWSASELRGMGGPRTSHSPGPSAEGLSASPGAKQEGAAGAAEPEPDMPLRGKDVALGNAFVERVLPDETTQRLALHTLLKKNVVSVVNLWATWCAPCKRELPEFRGLFAEHAAAWGDSVLFLPVLVEDSKDPVWVSKEYAERMPRAHMFLVDPAPDGIKSTLIANEVLAPETQLPVTLLVDCQRQVRWQQLGALDPAAFKQLTAQIDLVRAELGSDYCKRTRKRASSRAATPRRPQGLEVEAPPPLLEKLATTPEPSPTQDPTPPPQPAAEAPHRAKCGDGKCEPRLEDCSCRDCPSCKMGHVCTQRVGGGYFCKDEPL